MFTPHSFGVALAMMLIASICWGSWANTFKGVRDYRFELFYWDYAIGIFLWALILALTMGSSGHDASSFLANVHAADSSNIYYVLLAGAIFNLANLLLVAGIDLVGLATAFPVAIGIALVVGTVVSYILQPVGNLRMIIAGLLCAVVAVVLDGLAYAQMASNKTIERKGIIVCIVSGVLMGMWAPFSTRAMTHGATLGPYSASVFLCLGALLSCFIWNFYFMKHPLVGSPVAFSGFFRGPSMGHLLGLIGGAIWATGMVFDLVASNYTGVAISYAIGQSAPMVAALWGIFAWKEFEGASRKARAYLALMFTFYMLAILLVARASTS
jgi:glucose uptake protein